jgi:predicted RNase H-like HicB family nuclease
VEIPVLLEPLPDGGFRARSGDPLVLTAQGDSPDSALRNLRDLIETRISGGTLLTTIQVLNIGTGRHPGAGMYRDEPLFDDWKSAIDEYRQKIEDDPEVP